MNEILILIAIVGLGVSICNIGEDPRTVPIVEMSMSTEPVLEERPLDEIMEEFEGNAGAAVAIANPVLGPEPEPVIDINTPMSKSTLIEILGGLSYYVKNCAPLTAEGQFYYDAVIERHEINTELIELNPSYIAGQLAAATYPSCEALYEAVNELGGGDMLEQ
jgi:hypothetical protein